MKVHVERRDDRASTVVAFEFSDEEIQRAEIDTRSMGALRPPRVNFNGKFTNLIPTDWIQYVSWLARFVN